MSSYETWRKAFDHCSTQKRTILTEVRLAARKACGLDAESQLQRKRLARRVAKLESIARRTGYQCFGCGMVLILHSKATTIDHIVPQSHGGSNALTNLRLACMPCNSRRSSNDCPACVRGDCRGPKKEPHPGADRIRARQPLREIVPEGDTRMRY